MKIYFKIRIKDESYLEEGIVIGIFENDICRCLISQPQEFSNDKVFYGEIKNNVPDTRIDLTIKIWHSSTNTVSIIKDHITYFNIIFPIGGPEAPIIFDLFPENSSNEFNSSEDYEKYKIYTYANDEILKNGLKDYISETYSESYFNDAQKVDNKSIPIYDINYDALDRISFIKFKDTSKIIPFLNKYNLNDLSSVLLFNSTEFQLNDQNFDSILLDNFLYYIENVSTDVKNNIFDELFSLLSIESFTRILNPIGQIRSIRKNQYSLVENEYLYSISLAETLKLDDYPINYYSLKNLKSPELYQDYNLFKINQDSSIDAMHYDLENNIISELFRIYKTDVIDEFDKKVDESDVIKYSGKIIKENNILEDLINEYKNRYPNFSIESIRNAFKDFDDGEYHLNNSRFEEVYRIYALKYFNGLNIKYNRYNFTGSNAYTILNNLFKNAKQKMMNYVNGIYSKTKNIDNLAGSRAYKVCIEFGNLFEELLSYVSNDFSAGLIGIDGINAIKESLNHSFGERIIKFTNYEVFDNQMLSSLISENLFKIGLYRNNVSGLLNEISTADVAAVNAIPDTYVNENNEIINLKRDIITNFPIRLSNKIDDYLAVYNDMFDHENEFKMSGYLYGLRTYDKALKNAVNDLYLTYSYNTTFDKNFIKDNDLNFDINYINEIDENDDIKNIGKSKDNKINIININLFDDLDFSSADIILDGNFKIYKIDEDHVILLEQNDDNSKKIMNYLDMLSSVGKMQFSERLKGEHYYKETEHSKSNVISLNIKNSGLSYRLYTFLEIVNLICYENNLSFDESSCLFVDRNDEDKTYPVSMLMKRLAYYKMFEDEKTYFSEVEDDTNIKDVEYFKSFKYFKASENPDEVRRKIKQKIQIRKEFNNAIRKSIHRYIPVNTTLWKIDYNDMHSGATDEYTNITSQIILLEKNININALIDRPILVNLAQYVAVVNGTAVPSFITRYSLPEGITLTPEGILSGYLNYAFEDTITIIVFIDNVNSRELKVHLNIFKPRIVLKPGIPNSINGFVGTLLSQIDYSSWISIENASISNPS